MTKYKRNWILSLLRRSKPVWMIEGVWSGYTSSQSRCVHRHYLTDKDEVEKLQTIRYTDGTALYLSIKEIKDKKELLPDNDNYTSLINQCLKHNIWNVADLP